MERILRINRLIKEELSNILLKEVDIRSGIIMTLTRVDTSPNMIRSKVYFSVIPEENTEEISKILNSNIYNIQHLLNKKLKMRKVPRIVFVYDKSAGNAGKIEELLEKIEERSND